MVIAALLERLATDAELVKLDDEDSPGSTAPARTAIMKPVLGT
jgi:hypothetical protein